MARTSVDLENPVTALSEWKKGWRIVFAAVIGVASSGIPTHSLGVLLTPLTELHQWSRTEFAFSFTLVTVLHIVVSPLVGYVTDKFGPRHVAIAGLAVCGAAYASLSLVGSSLITWYALVLLVGIAAQGCGPVAWMSGITARFDKARGTAIAVTMAGLSLTRLIAPALTAFFLLHLGPSGAIRAEALTVFPLAIILALLLFRDPAKRRRPPEVEDAPAKQSSPHEAPKPGLSLRQALLGSRFWRLMIPMVVLYGGGGVVALLFVPMMTDGGASQMAAAAALGVMGVTHLIGRLACGALVDRVRAPLVGAGLFLIAAAGYMFLWLAEGNLVLGTTSMVLIGLAQGGGASVATYALSKYFGPRAFGTLFGLESGMTALAFGTLPLLAAYVRDTMGTYDPAIVSLQFLLLAGVVSLATLGRYPDLEQEPREAS